jgi:hypothetical protein
MARDLPGPAAQPFVFNVKVVEDFTAEIWTEGDDQPYSARVVDVVRIEGSLHIVVMLDAERQNRG